MSIVVQGKVTAAEARRAWQESKNQDEAARRLGIHVRTLQRILTRDKQGDRSNRSDFGQVKSESDDSGVELQLTDTEQRSLDELLDRAGTDRSAWEVYRHNINQWDMPAGNGEKLTCWQIKAWLRRKDLMPEALRASLLEAVKSAPAPRLKTVKPKKTGLLIEVAIPDLHYGMLAHDEQTGRGWNLERAESAFVAAVEDILELCRLHQPERVLFPFGNDFFHVDNLDGTTTSGTKMDTAALYWKVFREGVRLAKASVDGFRSVAPVSVLVVPGNHDETTCFTAGEVLREAFADVAGVTVDNAPTYRKYHRWGNVLLGFSHGRRERGEDLPLLMAAEKPVDWSETTWREWHLGDQHRKLELNEQKGVRVRYLPSLAGTDAWHSQRGFVGAQRGSEAYLWLKDRGYFGHYYFPIRDRDVNA